MIRYVFLLALLSPTLSQARIFDYKEASVAPYLRGTGGLSSLHQSAFEHTSGADTSVDGSTKFDYSGEIGVLLALNEKAFLRIGAELIQHRPVSNAAGTNPSGGERFRLESTVSAFNPNLTLEFVLKQVSKTFRYYGLLGVGMADVTVENKYTMTVLGTGDYPGVNSYNERLSASAIESRAGVGLETLFTSNATLALDLSYRYLPVETLKYKDDVTSIASPGGAHKGDEALNPDGSKRTLNLGGIIVGINFRFYL